MDHGVLFSKKEVFSALIVKIEVCFARGAQVDVFASGHGWGSCFSSNNLTLENLWWLSNALSLSKGSPCFSGVSKPQILAIVAYCWFRHLHLRLVQMHGHWLNRCDVVFLLLP
jgi:hypothetical protein